MEAKQPSRNLVTQRAHRQESWWQIWLPLAVGALAILGMAVWAVVVAVQGGSVSQAADTALIFVLLPVILMSLLCLIVVGGIVYLLARLLKIVPPKMLVVQVFFARIERGTRRAADKLVGPSLKLSSLAAAGRAFFSAFSN